MSTFGPAGPPLQRGVLEVPQSAHVFLTWPSSEEEPPPSWFLLLISSESDTWKQNKNHSNSQILNTHPKMEKDKSWVGVITHFLTQIHHFQKNTEKSKTDPDSKTAESELSKAWFVLQMTDQASDQTEKRNWSSVHRNWSVITHTLGGKERKGERGNRGWWEI